MLDPIWQFPFDWPPDAIASFSEASKSEVEEIKKNSSFDGQYKTQISGEGGKIDINDLASPSEPLANAVRTQILEIFRRKLEDDKDFKEEYDDFEFEDLVNDIADWIDEDDESRVSKGAETQRYEQPEGTNFKLPPNQGFKTTEEIHMVKGMDDTLYDILVSNITVFGTKGINVNQASAEIIKSLDPQITKEIAQSTIARRSDIAQGGPYRDDNDFFGFLEGKGVRTENLKKMKIPLLYDAEYNFRIVSVGQAVNSKREITAITYDIDGLTTRYVEILDQADKKDDKPPDDKPPDDKPPTEPPKDEPPAKKKVPVGRPTVVYWDEN